METLKSVLHPINKEGYPFIFIAAVATLLFFAFSSTLGWIGAIITSWCVYFFRDPERVIPEREGLIVSPGDGVISAITQVSPPKELDMGTEPMHRISIFLNIFNVHVNRVPIAGKVKKLHYNPGKFFNASLDKASEENERQSIWIETENGKNIAVVQIAGLVARRIVCNLQNEQKVETGKSFGIIRFGSRVDLYLPLDVNPLVVQGQTAIGGETIFADMNSSEEQRKGYVL